jgi:DNA-binding PadR family transcriptional regulator
MSDADPLRYRIRFLILTLLALGPSHGYELMKRLEEITQGRMRASPGSVYPVLRDLSREGLVEEDTVVESGRLRKIYRLTREGALRLLEELRLFNDITRRLLSVTITAEKALAEKLAQESAADCRQLELIASKLEELKKNIEAYIRFVREKSRGCSGHDKEAGEALD